MVERQKRLTEVYDYCRRNFNIHTQSDFAAVIKYTRSVVSAALNGREDYLTDKLFVRICEAIPNTFNLDYLLDGTGSLLIPVESVQPQPEDRPSSVVNQAANIIELYATLIKEIESIRADLKSELSALHAEREELTVLATTLRDCLQSSRNLLGHIADSIPHTVGSSSFGSISSPAGSLSSPVGSLSSPADSLSSPAGSPGELIEPPSNTLGTIAAEPDF